VTLPGEASVMATYARYPVTLVRGEGLRAPMGALVAPAALSSAPGEHASTFGGGPAVEVQRAPERVRLRRRRLREPAGPELLAGAFVASHVFGMPCFAAHTRNGSPYRRT